LRSTETKYQCDNCSRVTYNTQSLVGWRRFKLWREEDEEPDTQDICDSCAQALASILGKRRSIERGSYREQPMQEHLKSPSAADADAYAVTTRAPQPAAD